jgi:hypothetical protein
MKILFLCGSVEPGKDGVGDYSRRLCGALIRKGHQAQILALCDKRASNFISEIQLVEETPVVVNRIPIASSHKQRLAWTREILKEVVPDYISLQFVPYSFHAKGLPIWLPRFLKKLEGKYQWHIMFHELWIGMDTKASFKSRCIGFLQQKIVIKILKNLKNLVVNTQTNLYQQKISNLGYSSQLLPIFSNISKTDIVETISVKKNSNDIRFGMFGGIQFGAPVQLFINAFQLELKKTKGAVLKFVFIGNCGDAIKEWTSVLDVEQIEYEILGYCSEQEISTALVSCDYGIATTPGILAQKSGSNLAMLQHGLSLICVARDWKVKGFDSDEIQGLSNVVAFRNQSSISDFVEKQYVISNEGTLEAVTSSFLEGLKKSK